MQKYKALEDLGVKREDCYQNWMEDGEKEDPRYSEWLKQKEEYGIDERATWNWSDEFIDYIYIHLEMFNRVNKVDFNSEEIMFEGFKYTVQQAIDFILDWLRTTYYPLREDKFDVTAYKSYEAYTDDVTKYLEEKHRMLQLFAAIIDHLNW